MSEQEGRPLHRTITDALHRTKGWHSTARGIRLSLIAFILNGAKVPKDHDELIEIWSELTGHLGDEAQEVTKHLREQKRIAEEKAESEKSVDLDELQEEAEKLLALLKDRRGTVTWNHFLFLRISRIRKLTSCAS